MSVKIDICTRCEYPYPEKDRKPSGIKYLLVEDLIIGELCKSCLLDLKVFMKGEQVFEILKNENYKKLMDLIESFKIN